MLFSPPLKLALAAFLTLLVDLAAASVAKRLARSSSAMPRVIAPRKYWCWSGRGNRYPELLPVIFAAAHIVLYMGWDFMSLMALRDPPKFLLDTTDSPISIAGTFQLTNLAFLAFFAAHLFRGLLPGTSAPSSERFVLIYASILIATSCFSMP